MITTVLTGVLVFVIGQLLIKLVVDPINGLKLAFAETSNVLLVNAPFIYNAAMLSAEDKKQTRERLLALSGKIHAAIMLVPCYQIWGRAFFLPSKAKLYEAAQDLIAVGNWVQSNSSDSLPQVIKHLQNCSDIIGIYISPNSRIDNELLAVMIRNSFGTPTVAQQAVQPEVPASGRSSG